VGEGLLGVGFDELQPLEEGEHSGASEISDGVPALEAEFDPVRAVPDEVLGGESRPYLFEDVLLLLVVGELLPGDGD
jgi:hypothetical protein